MKSTVMLIVRTNERHADTLCKDMTLYPHASTVHDQHHLQRSDPCYVSSGPSRSALQQYSWIHWSLALSPLVLMSSLAASSPFRIVLSVSLLLSHCARTGQVISTHVTGRLSRNVRDRVLDASSLEASAKLPIMSAAWIVFCMTLVKVPAGAARTVRARFHARACSLRWSKLRVQVDGLATTRMDRGVGRTE